MTATRVLTALVMAPAVMALVWFAPLPLLAVAVALVALLALHEFFAIGRSAQMHGYWLWCFLCAAALMAVQTSQAGVETLAGAGGVSLVRAPESAWLSVEFLLLVFALGITLAGTLNRKPVAETLGAVGMSAASLLLVALPLSYLIRVQGAEAQGRLWTLFLLWLVWAGDSIAYFTGRAIGKHAMAPEISPKKTWEGAAGNLLGSILVAAVFSRWLDVPLAHLVAVAALANVAGQAGDLLESAYKRSAGVKDSGTILPGHGGVLDRIDALIFAAPVVWLYQQFVIR